MLCFPSLMFHSEILQANTEKPKRPISAMFIFSEEKRPKLQQERPDLSESELTRLLARMWNELPDKKKVSEVITGNRSNCYVRFPLHFFFNYLVVLVIQEKYKRLETVLKAESEKKEKEDRSRLPDPPKTAQDIWQQSVIGDYLARFKVHMTHGVMLQYRLCYMCCIISKGLTVSTLNQSHLFCRMTGRRHRKQWRQPGAPWRRKRRSCGSKRQRRTRRDTRWAVTVHTQQVSPLTPVHTANES